MFYFVTLASILFSLISILISLITFGSVRDKVKFPIVVDFLAFMATINIILWHLMPAVLRLFSGGQHEIADLIDPAEILEVYSIEFLSLFVFLCSFFIFTGISKLKLTYIRRSSLKQVVRENTIHIRNFYLSYLLQRVKPEKFFLIFIVSLGVLFNIQRLIIGIQPTIIPALDWLIVPIVLKAALFLLVHNVFISELSRKKIEKIISLVVLFFFLLLDGAQGSHGSLFAPILYLVFYNIFHNKNSATIKLSFLMVVFLALFYEEMHQVRAYANMAKVDRLGPVEKIQLIINSDTPLSNTHTPGSGFLDKVEWRFGEHSRMSVGYLRMYNRGKSAGLNPLENSFHLLPRYFYLDKPIPGSIDGSELGLGMRLIHREIRGTLWNMSGFFTGLHSYWEFGLGGVVVVSLFVGAFSVFLIFLCGNFKYLGLPLMIIMHDTWWWSTPKIWSYEISIQLFNLLIPFLFIWVIVKLVYTFVLNLKSQIMQTVVVNKKPTPF